MGCDYGAESPLWAPAEEGAMVHLADLPLTDDLRRGLEDWVAQWNELRSRAW